MAELSELRELEDDANDLEKELFEKRLEVLEAGLKDADLSNRKRAKYILHGFAGEQPAREDQIEKLLMCFMNREEAQEVVASLAQEGELIQPAKEHIKAV